MKSIRIALLIILTSLPAFNVGAVRSHAFGREINGLLDSLDVVLSHADGYLARKEQRIESLRSTLARAAEPEQRYWITRDLYEENCAYDSDSALYYANQQYDIARSLGRINWQDEANLHRCYLYSATGLLDQARQCIEAVDSARLSESLFVQYYENLLFLWTHRNQYLDDIPAGEPYSRDVDELLESLTRTLPQTDPRYCWFIGWRALESKERAVETLPLIEKAMAGRRYETRDDAKDAWILSRLYDKAGDSENSIKYLILSSIADVKACNKEIASLEELSSLLYKAGEYGRANDYISYCIQCANSYKSRIRVGRLADLQYHISKGYSDQNAAQARQINRYLTVLVVILLILTVAIIFIYVQMRRLRRSRRQLHDANDELHSRVSELQEVRSRLNEANQRLTESYSSACRGVEALTLTNEAKEKIICDLFSICSNNISKIDDFRKHVNRLVVAGRYDEVRELVKSPEMSQSELREFYANFDRIFLQIYPDFVADFNGLLRPDEQISPRRGELLTTDLRIYALVRLGINDSVKISKFLHISSQTVYNTRMRTRNKALVPKEEFTDAVRKLGTANL
ncbi:MAG: DUF6377 domain-containing protein [Bacteroidales bacterium]|nr:DUF6377 domain-containing protein [Bacteroidales bacterium]